MKRLLCVVICIVVLFSFSSCDSAETGVTVGNKRVVALSSESTDFNATVEYCEKNGYSYNTYNSFNDCILALENGKAEYIVLNDFEYNNFNLNEDTVKFVEKTDYKHTYHAVIAKGNEKLYNEINNAIKTLSENGILENVKQGYFKGERIDIIPSSISKGDIKVLCCAGFTDKVFYNSDGELSGIDIYVAEAVLTYLGYTPVFVDSEFDEMFYNLQKDEGDIIFSSVIYTDQRAEDYLLTDAYYTETYSVYKRVGK